MMTTEELKKLKADKVVDARGTACPGPLLAVKQAIADVPDGGIMEILSSDEGTKKDVPRWAEKRGYQYLGDFEESGYFTIYLKK
jgi:tRNA 2-thiouridine synthesizing protein A